MADYIPYWYEPRHWASTSYKSFPFITCQWQWSDGEYTNGWYGTSLYSNSSCTAHALATVVSIFQYNYSLRKIRYSYMWIYGNRSPNDETGEGMVPKFAIDQVAIDGVPLYIDCPYQLPYSYIEPNAYSIITKVGATTAKDVVINNKSRLAGQAIVSRISPSYELLDPLPQANIDIVKNSVQVYGCALLSLYTGSDIYSTGGNGIVTDLYPQDGSMHLICIFGWKRINGLDYWVCANSWGYDGDYNGGNVGIFYIPFTFSKSAYFLIVRPAIYGFPKYFNWSNNITSGGDMYNSVYDSNSNTLTGYVVTANDWNTFTSKINNSAAYKSDGSYPFTQVIPGSIFTNTIVNQAIGKLNNLYYYCDPGLMTYMSDVSHNDNISASLLNTLRDNLNNSII